MTDGRDIIITGIPRSGTTLVCHLLNKLSNVVALHEPINQERWSLAKSDGTDALVGDYFSQSRKSLLTRKTAISKQYQGRVPDNSKRPDSWRVKALQVLGVGRVELDKLRLDKFGLRRSIVEHGLIRVDKVLSDDFTLCIKHNGQFTALLPSLVDRYKVYAIIRNPLAVLCSWNSIDFGPRDGHMYSAEKLTPKLTGRLVKCSNRYQRQLVLLSWFYEQYVQHIPSGDVIRYEDIIRSKGQALSSCVESMDTLNEPLENNNQAYNDRQLNALLAEKLLDSDGAYWQFYTPESVSELAEKIS